MTVPRWHIGIDAGGTKTELLAASTEAEQPVRLTGPGANLQQRGLDTTVNILADLVRQFLHQAPDRHAHALCAGISGAGRLEDQEQVTTRLRAALDDEAPFRLKVVHDGEIALEAAFEGESGIITIAGTGSLALARAEDGSLLRAGGWGYLLGDDGSGYALGRAGLRAVAAAYDGGPATRLQALLADYYHILSNEELIQRIYRDGWPIQQMAPLVIAAAENGDAVAQALVRHETQALARQVAWLAGQEISIKPQLAPLGGLTNEPYYRTALAEALQEQLPGWTIQAPAHRPAVGALLLARKAAG